MEILDQILGFTPTTPDQSGPGKKKKKKGKPEHAALNILSPTSVAGRTAQDIFSNLNTRSLMQMSETPIRAMRSNATWDSLKRDHGREAADNSNAIGKYLTQNNEWRDIKKSPYEDFKGLFIDDSDYGYNDRMYARPLPHEQQPYYQNPLTKDRNGDGEFNAWRDLLPNLVEDRVRDMLEVSEADIHDPGNLGNMLLKFKDDVKYGFLYPYYDAEQASYVLKEFIGTKDEFKKANLGAFNAFGPQREDDNFGNAMHGALYSSTAQMDDMVLGGAKMVKDLGYAAFFNLDKEQVREDALDRLYRKTREDSEFNLPSPTKNGADDMLSGDYWGNAVGSVLGSYVQFGTAGRAAAWTSRSVMAGKNVLAGTFKEIAKTSGSTLVTESAKRQAASNMARYGASGFVSMTHSYNEAKSEGLSDKEALMFGIAVGGISAAVESTGLLGKTDMLDKWLMGGGRKAASEVLRKELVGKAVNTQTIGAATKKVLPGVVVAAKRFKDSMKGRVMLEEMGEEAVQTFVEQAGKMVFNTWAADKDASEGKGKFSNAELNVKEIIGAALAGALGAGMTMGANGAVSAYLGTDPMGDTVMSFITEGKTKQLFAGLDLLQEADEITPLQHKNYKEYLETMDAVYTENQDVFSGLGGVKAPQLRRKLFTHLEKMRNHQVQGEKHIQEATRIQSETVANGGQISATVQKQIDGMKELSDKAFKEADKEKTEIDKYRSAAYVKEKENELLAQDDIYQEILQNSFEMLIKPYEKPETDVTKILARNDGTGNTPAFRVASEFQAGLVALQQLEQAGETEKATELRQRLSRDLALTGMHRNAAVWDDFDMDTAAKAAGLSAENVSEENVTSDNFGSFQSKYNYAQAALEEKHKDSPETLAAITPYDIFKHMAMGQQNESMTLHDYQLSQLYNPEESANWLDMLRAADKDAADSIFKVWEMSGKPVTPVFMQSERETPRGFYHPATGILVVEGNFKKASPSGVFGMGSATEAKKILAAITHETTHQLLDDAISEGFMDYVGWLKSRDNKDATPAALHFRRMLDLAILSHDLLSGRRKQGSPYFMNQIFPKTKGSILVPDASKNGALELVREYMAEAFSNKEFQEDLASIDLNSKDSKISEQVKRRYNYAQIYDRPNTLLDEVVKAAKSIFGKLRNILTGKQRSALREMYDLASALQISNHYGPEQQQAAPVEYKYMSVTSAYEPELMEAASAGIALEDLAVSMLRDFAKIDTLNRYVVSNPENNRKFIDNIAKVQERIAGDFQQDSIRVVYFKNTSDVLISWIDEDGNTQRQFINMYGKPRQINTNVESDAPNTIAKPRLEIFSNEWKGDAKDEKQRGIANNFERAKKEAFGGKMQLKLSEGNWYFNGEWRNGEVEIHYQQADGQWVPIGYMNDLTKVRLTNLMMNGAQITVEAGTMGEGSAAFVKYAENGDIEHIKTIPSRTAINTMTTPEGYQLVDDLLPNLEVVFTGAQNMPPPFEDGDTFTTHGSPLDSTEAGLATSAEIMIKKIITPTARVFAHQVRNVPSFFEPLSEADQELASKLTKYDNWMQRMVRRFLARNPASEHSVKEAKSRYQALLDERILPALQEQFPDHPLLETFGFESEEAYAAHRDAKSDEISREVGGYINRAGAADWDGHGLNPSNTVSAKIKYDLETIHYIFKGKQEMLDYEEGVDVIYKAISGVETFDELLEALRKLAASDVYSERERAIAIAIADHLQEPLTEDEAAEWEASKHSYVSQFASVIRRDAYVFQPSGDGVKVYAASNDQESREMQRDYARRVRATGEAMRESFLAEKEKNPSLTFSAFFASQFPAVFNKNGEQKTLTGMISSYKERFHKLALGTDSINPSTVSQEDYDEMLDQVLGFLETMGLEVPRSLAERTHIGTEEIRERVATLHLQQRKAWLEEEMNTEFVARMEKGEDEALVRESLNATFKEKMDAYRAEAAQMQGADRYAYTKVPFSRSSLQKLKGKSKAERVIESGEHSFFELYLQLADKIILEVRDSIGAGKPDTLDTNAELMALSKAIAKIEGGYRSPMFYMDVNQNKRYSLKTRSYSDSLIEGLRTNKNGILTRYANSPIYRHNAIIRQLMSGATALEHVAISGVAAERDTDGKGVDYENASEVDFHYMALAGFVGGRRFSYWHVDDVPSDKPNNSAFQVPRHAPTAYELELRNILLSEKTRFSQAAAAFEKGMQAAEIADEDGELIEGYYEAGDAEGFRNLIEGVHYVVASKKGGDPEAAWGKFKDGPIFNGKNTFFGEVEVTDTDGTRKLLHQIERETAYETEMAKAAYILAEIESQANAFFDYYTGMGLRIPVDQTFLNVNKDNPDLPNLIKERQKELYYQFTVNGVINRYALSQLQMGDYAFYKAGDEFGDLNKRKAGPMAPYQRGVWQRQQAQFAILRDVKEDHKLIKTRYNIEKKAWEVDPDNTAAITTNRGDAQGYMTEAFLKEIQEAYGSYSEYENPLKPVMFGVNEQHINEARPLYMKLSLSILPDPNEESNKAFYEQQPALYPIAQQLYASGASLALFESGVKTGAGQKTTQLPDENGWPLHSFDLNKFGLQNNPSHEVTEADTISGMVQMLKQLADNGNFEKMQPFYNLIVDILQPQAATLMNDTLGNEGRIRKVMIEQLSRQEHTTEVADLLKRGARLDHPALSSYLENMINAMVHKKLASPKLPGSKLVNLSELGFTRGESLSEEEQENMTEAVATYLERGDKTLRWKGPRTYAELSLKQLQYVEARIEAEGIEKVFEGGDREKHVLAPDGSVQIFGADILVPEGAGYAIGDEIISVRIPTSSKNSMIPGEVVGFLPRAMGNVIVTPKEGPGVLGFDFDIDGLFTWRKVGNGAKTDEMFAIAYGILTAPATHNEMVQAVSTDEMGRLADRFGAGALKRRGIKPNRFMPQRQFMLKELNSVGKTMIGITGKAYGEWSVLSQIGAELLPSKIGKKITNFRGYNINGKIVRNYPQLDTAGRMVLDNFQQTMNSSTDNAKLQELFRAGLNAITASVYMDMLAHGFSMEHTLLLLNQDSVQDMVAEKTRRSNASTNEVHQKNEYETVKDRWEARAKAIDPNYAYNPIDGATGRSTRQDIIFRTDYTTVQTKEGETKVIGIVDKMDRRKISMKSLDLMYETKGQGKEGGMDGRTSEEKELAYIDAQLAVLEKFKYYGELASVTAGAGAVIQLASKYPKTYMDALGSIERINNVSGKLTKTPAGRYFYQGAKIDIAGLLHKSVPGNVATRSQEHSQYQMHHKYLQGLVNLHHDNKLYAKEIVQAGWHRDLTQGLSSKMKKRVQREFYNYVLTDTPLFSTANYNGQLLNAKDFVHQATDVIDHLKGQLPDNAFLRLLGIERKTQPNTITFRLLNDLTPQEMKRLHDAFYELPGSLSPWRAPELHPYKGEHVDVQRMLMAYLAHTQGFNMSGYSFSKILPTEVKMLVNDAITQYADKVSNRGEAQQEERREAFETSDQVDEQVRRMVKNFFGTPKEGHYADALFEVFDQYGWDNEMMLQVAEEIGISQRDLSAVWTMLDEMSDKTYAAAFARQVLLNNPSMQAKVQGDMLAKAKADGTIRRVGNEIHLNPFATVPDKNNIKKRFSADTDALINFMRRKGVFKILDIATNKEVTYEVKREEGDSLVIVKSDFEYVKGILQYTTGDRRTAGLVTSVVDTQEIQEAPDEEVETEVVDEDTAEVKPDPVKMAYAPFDLTRATKQTQATIQKQELSGVVEKQQMGYEVTSVKHPAIQLFAFKDGKTWAVMDLHTQKLLTSGYKSAKLAVEYADQRLTDLTQVGGRTEVLEAMGIKPLPMEEAVLQDPESEVYMSNPLLRAGIKPTAKDWESGREGIDYHMVKDIAMAFVATQFIGEKTVSQKGDVKSSTDEYRAAWGERANTGQYTADDVIMVSGSGPWRGVQMEDIVAKLGTFYKPLLEKGINAKAAFVLGNALGSDQLIGRYLTMSGYRKEDSGKGYDIYSHPDNTQTFDAGQQVSNYELLDEKARQELGAELYGKVDASHLQKEYSALANVLTIDQYLEAKKAQLSC